MAWGESRRGTPIMLVGIHTNEGDNPPHLYPDRTAENLADWLTRENNAGRHKSYQTIVDDDSAVEYVPDHLASWAMRSGNLRSVNLCFTGWARWSRAEWLDHPAMLARGAAKVRHWCAVHGIPTRKITGTQIRAGLWGICGHGDWSDSDLDDSTHTDPGPNFPWDVFMAMVNRGDDMTDDERDALYDLREQVCGARPVGQYPGWPTAVGDLTLVDMVRRLIEEVAVEDLAQRADVGFARDQLVERLVRVEAKLDELLERSTDTEPVT